MNSFRAWGIKIKLGSNLISFLKLAYFCLFVFCWSKSSYIKLTIAKEKNSVALNPSLYCATIYLTYLKIYLSPQKNVYIKEFFTFLCSQVLIMTIFSLSLYTIYPFYLFHRKGIIKYVISVLSVFHLI